MLDREQLETFAAIADHKSFELAAIALNVSRSAVSQRVKALEEFLATTLLVREKPVIPTPRGEILLRHVRALKLLERETLNAMQPRASENLPVSVAIAVNADSLETWLKPLLIQVMKGNRMALEIHVDDQDHTFNRLSKGEVLGCISSKNDPISGFAASPLGAMQYSCVATPAFNEKFFEKGITVPSMSTAPAVLFDRKDGLHDQYFERVFNVKITRYHRHYVPSPTLLLDTILSGAAYGLVPKQQCEALLVSGQIIDLTPCICIDVALYWHHWSGLNIPLATEVTRAIKAQALKTLYQTEESLQSS
jgi:LysR family transcriptional regulator, chromosome initiation inhibitor